MLHSVLSFLNFTFHVNFIYVISYEIAFFLDIYSQSKLCCVCSFIIWMKFFVVNNCCLPLFADCFCKCLILDTSSLFYVFTLFAFTCVWLMYKFVFVVYGTSWAAWNSYWETCRGCHYTAFSCIGFTSNRSTGRGEVDQSQAHNYALPVK